MTKFRDAVQGTQPAISAELTIRRESTADDIRRQADILADWVDGFQVTESGYAWVQMSATAAAVILLEHGVDPVPIITCRDRNRAALERELAGLQALGARSLILARGPRVPKRHAVRAGTVFDLSGRELIALAQQKGDFFVGTAVQAANPRPGWRAESLLARMQAGAAFIQTQLCLNPPMVRRYIEALSQAGLIDRPAVVVSLTPLPSAETARWIRRTMTGSRIPDSVIRRLEEASDPVQEGIRICAELMEEIATIEGVSGINLLTTGDAEAIPATIRASGLRGGR